MIDLQQLQQQLQQQQQQQPPPAQQQLQQKNQNQQLLTQLLVQQLQQQQSQMLDQDKAKNKDSETPKSERDYISHTSICPNVVLSENDVIVGISVENSIYNTLKVIEVCPSYYDSSKRNFFSSINLFSVLSQSTLSQPPVPFESSTLHWMTNGFYYNQINNAGMFRTFSRLTAFECHRLTRYH